MQPDYTSEIESRAVQYTRPSVYVLAPGATPGGYLTLVTAKSSSPLLVILNGALATNNVSNLAALLAPFDHVVTLGSWLEALFRPLADFAGLKISTPTEIPQSGKEPSVDLSEVPVLVELRYMTKTLASGLFISDYVNGSLAQVPYNGGTLDSAQFQVAEYRRQASEPISSTVIVQPPILSQMEIAMLQRVPAAKSEIHLGVQEPATARVATAYAFGIATRAAGLAVNQIARTLGDVTLATIDAGAEFTVADKAAVMNHVHTAADGIDGREIVTAGATACRGPGIQPDPPCDFLKHALPTSDLEAGLSAARLLAVRKSGLKNHKKKS